MRKIKKHKLIVMLMAMVLLFGVSAQATMAYLTVKTEPVKNTFVPVHSPVHDLDITVTGEKDVVEYVEEEGKQVAKPAWKEGDAFNFEVQVWEGNRWETVGTAAVAYDKDKDDFNKFDVSEIIKNQIAEPGEYSFRIAETKGSDSTITYDETACRFDVVVKADDTGAMDITEVKDIEDAKIVKDSESGDYTVAAAFTNKYTAPVIPPEPVDPDPIKIEFIVDKTVKNIGEEEIGPKGFDFKLVKDSTKEEWTEEADENGYAAFEMTYTKDDIGKTYLYELSEVNDGVEGVSYCEDVYDIAVSITLDEEENKLETSIKMNDKIVSSVKAEFENIYDGAGGGEVDPGDPGLPTDPTDPDKPTKPDKPDKPGDPTKPADKDPGSKTGDDFNMIPLIAIMIAALAVMTVVIISGRRRKI